MQSDTVHEELEELYNVMYLHYISNTLEQPLIIYSPKGI